VKIDPKREGGVKSREEDRMAKALEFTNAST